MCTLYLFKGFKYKCSGADMNIYNEFVILQKSVLFLCYHLLNKEEIKQLKRPEKTLNFKAVQVIFLLQSLFGGPKNLWKYDR